MADPWSFVWNALGLFLAGASVRVVAGMAFDREMPFWGRLVGGILLMIVALGFFLYGLDAYRAVVGE